MKVAKLILSAENRRGLGGPDYLGDQSPRGVFL
nr:MAG TPA: hypothetical protein [Caudoviricetes sp.]